jgi:hypothetical protein
MTELIYPRLALGPLLLGIKSNCSWYIVDVEVIQQVLGELELHALRDLCQIMNIDFQ